MAIIEYDCAIVGAGFVGATLAIALRKCGLKVLVLDGRTPLLEVGSEDVRGIALSPSSRFIFEDLDLWNGLAERAEPITAINISEMGALPSVDLSASEAGIDALAYVVPADHLLRTIENKLLEDAQTPDCQLLWRTSLESYRVSSDHVSITVVDHEQLRSELSARLLIGADGVNSKVRALANIGSKIRAYNQHAIVATVKVEGIKANLAYERFTPTGPIALLPMTGGRHVVVRCCLLEETEFLLALTDAEFIDDISDRFARPVGKFSALGARRSHPLVLSQAETSIAERVALVGAAAVTVHPNGAQGLNLGLRDAAALCEVIIKAGMECENDLTLETLRNFVGSAEQLRTFANNRRQDHRRVVRFTDSMARGFTSNIPGARFIRRSGLLVTKLLPALQRQIIYEGVGQDRFLGFSHVRESLKSLT
jgi:2-octaprenyl-6-methoxyphenol hydroxylase